LTIKPAGSSRPHDAFYQLLTFDPAHADALHLLGVIALQTGRYDQAIHYIRQAIGLHGVGPNHYSNIGYALHRFRLNHPDLCDAHVHLGNALFALGRPAEAEASYREALRLRPNYPEAHNNLGSVLYALGRPGAAEASYRESLRLRPNYPEAHNNLGFALLLAGRFEEGWKECEWRWKTELLARSAREFSVPLWSGEAIGDRIILLHAEQGLGDTLQFCRYVPLVVCGGGIILEVQASLVRLLSRLPGIMEIVARGDTLPPFDLYCPLMSLPLAFGTTLDTIPAATPYLSANPALAANWQKRLAGLDGLRIGLVWAGSIRLSQPEAATTDRRRSLALDAMAPLSEASGVSFISLQKDEPAAQAANPPRGMTLLDFTADLHDFEDTAALIVNLDLVISVDTSVAHLAGALGKPVWLLNRFDTCWRWLLNRDDSPWYPTLRQFRQPRPGDWATVICEMQDALRRLAAGDRHQLRASPGQDLAKHNSL
jgi:tetratricopeptide (TPR) repeat protein